MPIGSPASSFSMTPAVPPGAITTSPTPRLKRFHGGFQLGSHAAVAIPAR